MSEYTDWDDIKERVVTRERIVREIADGLKPIEANEEIASIDLFVEKAQIDLSNRSEKMFIFAAIALSASAMIFVICLIILILFGEKFQLDADNWRTLVATVLRNATFLGVILGGLYVTLSLFRSFMHEGTTLQNRIHSTRLGRLFLYVKLISADAKQIDAIRNSLNATEMERVFGWNIETSTAFKDIDPHMATKTLLGSAIESVPETIKNFRN
jgi:hypothetical protein